MRMPALFHTTFRTTMVAARTRWPEFRAAMAWALGSWIRPGSAEAGWQQGPAHDRRRR
jgi:hypothetical protein